MRILLFIFFFGFWFGVMGQHIGDRITTSKVFSNLTFKGTRGIDTDEETDEKGYFTVGGYISTYYAGYSDTSGLDGFQKFPTVAPRKDNFGLNMVMISMKYRGKFFRANTAVQYGDIPLSSWSPEFNNVQEANLGFRVLRNLWIDGGFFRTHIGLESIQPRENITMSVAVATYYEPYYLSGAKISYIGLSKIKFQLSVFNGFNGFVESNKSKTYGASVLYLASEEMSITYNFLTCDESESGDGTQQRFYNNLTGSYSHNKWKLGFDFNYGIQNNSGLADPSKTIYMYSGLLVGKFQLHEKYGVYARFSYFQDRNEMLTGPIRNKNQESVGLDLFGTTVGMEYKPITNSYIRLESRMLYTGPGETVFYPLNGDDSRRIEIMVGLGVWF